MTATVTIVTLTLVSLELQRTHVQNEPLGEPQEKRNKRRSRNLRKIQRRMQVLTSVQ